MTYETKALSSEVKMQVTKSLFPILIACLLTSCQTSKSARVELTNTANPWEICVAAGDNRPFAKGRKAAGMALVRERGYECDWQAVGAHWQEFQRNNLAGMQNALEMMKQSQWQTYDGTPVNAAPDTTSTGGYLKSQSTSGQMRYCSYNQMGSTVIVTIARHEICPLTN